MGVTLKNIQSLIKLPSGCGEQTMLGTLKFMIESSVELTYCPSIQV